jgi:Na+/phosphate symporter
MEALQIDLIGPLLGGLGLFLLGMGMMTDGLRLAAGGALQRILGAATRTRWHALGSGILVTALLAAVGATPNARRAAAVHVIFNLITASVALVLLPWLIAALTRAQQTMGLADDPAILVALFHTVFNLLGVVLMWPLQPASRAGCSGAFGHARKTRRSCSSSTTTCWRCRRWRSMHSSARSAASGISPPGWRAVRWPVPTLPG